MNDKLKLTRAETAALWHAVQWMSLCVVEVTELDKDDPIQIADEARLALAKQALRKVNAIRKAQAANPIVAGRTKDMP